MIPIVCGEVLYDQFPDGTQTLGGAPFNVAWHLNGLGLNPRLVTRVGSDPAGIAVLERMSAAGLAVSGVQIDPDRPTGLARVELVEGEPRFELPPGQAFDALDGPRAVAGLSDLSGGLLIHGSLIARTADGWAALQAMRSTFGQTTLVDVNLRPPWADLDRVRQTLSPGSWVKCNLDELTALDHGGEGDIAAAARRLVDRHQLACCLVTLGAGGALAACLDGTLNRMPAALVPDLVDTVGAGDAFTATTAAGRLAGWPIPLLLKRAADLAGAVCGLRGALPPDPAWYEPWRQAWELPGEASCTS